MTLQAYLAANKMSMSEFARRINVSHESVRRYVSGNRAPEWAIMERIVIATHGKVTANDFLAQRVAA